MKFFDSHAHIDDKRLDNKYLGKNLREAGIGGVVIPGVDQRGWARILEMAREEDIFYPSLGIHPQEVSTTALEVLGELEKMLQTHPQVVAIGEIGLDLHWRKDNLDLQRHWFKEQMLLAKKHNLPIIVHDREANSQVFDLIEEVDPYGSGVIMHCYSGHVPLAKAYVQRGAFISLAGPVTFQNARVPKEVALAVPLENLLIETDSPYLTPHPFRGKRNNPSYVRYVAQEIADIKGLSLEEVARVTFDNARRAFKL
ncbi:MAG: TatD family hydrolase [Tissierellia bacterium]|nr:TatD family hydrolase [Tissierellia bacterium]